MSSSPFSDAAAQKVAQEASEQTEQEQPEEQLTEEQQQALSEKEFFDRLKDTYGDGAPTREQLDTWKSQSGRVRWIELGPDEIYFFRGFKSAEYKGWIESLRKTAETDPQKADEVLRQRIVARCVLFPKIDESEMGSMLAGTTETLFEQIRLASNFIPYEQAMQLVREW